MSAPSVLPPSGGPLQDPPPTDHDRTARSMVIAVHSLYLAAIPIPLVPLLVGVALAYMARGASAAPWRGHLDQAIATSWICALLFLIGVPLLPFFLLGVIPMTLAVVLLVFRATRGLLRALSWQGV
ncbi:hypothetical protein [Roseospira visakhapatnamensis]|uniref:Putative membrane protein n=1 Tax=Roseospira visakhapatnamensis TaxID=390880 RepID=A0A7W6W9N8_9PROT|nr:hypothetical protein [Roseospira visakhapatnamensis]MBB4265637.1 putative membrane protein [Roseospira visakhapatnamensis]